MTSQAYSLAFILLFMFLCYVIWFYLKKLSRAKQIADKREINETIYVLLCLCIGFIPISIIAILGILNIVSTVLLSFKK